MTLYFITGNKNKFAEINSILGGVLTQEAIDLPEIQSLDPHEVIAAKLAEARKQGKVPCIVEDTGYECDGLNGLPGTFAKFFQNKMTFERIAEIFAASGNAKGYSRTVIGYFDGAQTQFFEGVLPGTFVSPLGTEGWGWDVVFQPAGETRTLAELGPVYKNTHSARFLAAQRLKAFLEKHSQ